MRRLLVTLALCAGFFVSSLSAQAPDHDVVMQAWGWAKGCTMQHEQRGRLDQIVWQQFSFGSRVRNSSKVYGEWVAPDTIFIAIEYADSVWVVAHEMVHHILGPTSDAHPVDPFLFPCQLMPIQHVGSGVHS